MSICQDMAAATFFAPAGRDSNEAIRHAEDLIRSAPFLQATLDAMSEMVLILNGRRQTVGCNQALCDTLSVSHAEVIGKRPGELVGCIHSKEGPDGCGTAENCMNCGAVKAILKSQQSHGKISKECRISIESMQNGGAMDLNVTASPCEVNNEIFTICCIKDISQTKRLAVLTRMFFHDVLNTAGGVRGFAEMLADQDTQTGAESEDLVRMQKLTGLLVEEIESQRDLTQAESGSLGAHFELVSTTKLLENLQTLYATHEVAGGSVIELCNAWQGTIRTDRRLLTRVLGNMLKNALEASGPGERVTIRCSDQGDSVALSVENPAVMPNHVKMQVFQRSFSTKAKSGRGVGTYSMKLFGESYLGGRVTFRSQGPEGTAFTIVLPKQPESAIASDDDQESARPETHQHSAQLCGRILLAEDSLDNQRLISFHLKKAGLDVGLAENGRVACEEALSSAAEGRPYDLILMDVNMPELSGLEATQELRQHGWQGPIVALTASGEKGDRERCLEAGCDDYATKPIDRASLLATVARHLTPSDG